MTTCPLCNSLEYDSSNTCRCGYNYKETKIVRQEKTIAYYKNLKRTEHWIEAATFTLKLHEFQQKRKGKTRYGTRGGWGYRDTAKLIKESLSIVSDNINLAKDSEDLPELINCDNLNKAKQLRKSLSFGLFSREIEKCSYEDDLQKYLETYWDKTPFNKEWKLPESQVNAGHKKRIDLLAHHRTKNCWLVIELKKDKTYKKTVAQLLRYIGWIKHNRADKNDEVKGLIISGYPPDKDLQYALSGVSDIDHMIYYRYKKNKKTDFMDADLAYKIYEIEKLPRNQQKDKFESLGNE